MQTVSDGTSVLLTDKGAGAFVPITGDVDVVAITSTNGTLLDAQQRLAVYESLQSIDGIGMQHGDTVSWLTGGEAQVKLLTGHVGDNAERLLVFDPVGGARTATIDAAHTTFTAKDNSLNGIWYVGAYKTPVRKAFENVVVTFHGASETVVPWISPTSWYLTGQSTLNPIGGPPGTGGPTTGGNDGSLGNCPWQFSTGDGAKTLIPDGNGGLLQFIVGQGWVPYTPQVICIPPTGGGAGNGAALRRAAIPTAALPTIEVLPQTALNADATKGATSLTLIPLSLVDPALDPATTPWFATGERIVIDPGAADQTYATIVAGTGSPTIRLDRPLTRAYPAGVMVSVVHATASPTTTVTTSTPTPSSGSSGSSGSSQLADTGPDLPGQLELAWLFIAAGVAAQRLGRGRRRGRTRPGSGSG